MYGAVMNLAALINIINTCMVVIDTGGVGSPGCACLVTSAQHGINALMRDEVCRSRLLMQSVGYGRYGNGTPVSFDR